MFSEFCRISDMCGREVIVVYVCIGVESVGIEGS